MFADFVFVRVCATSVWVPRQTKGKGTFPQIEMDNYFFLDNTDLFFESAGCLMPNGWMYVELGGVKFRSYPRNDYFPGIYPPRSFLFFAPVAKKGAKVKCCYPAQFKVRQIRGVKQNLSHKISRGKKGFSLFFFLTKRKQRISRSACTWTHFFSTKKYSIYFP